MTGHHEPAFGARRVAYADPPYPGQSRIHYKDHPDYAGEVDHYQLVKELRDYDAWALSTSSTALKYLLALCPAETRVAAWVKPFAAFKNQRITMAWEPVLYVAPNGPVARERPFLRDWVSAAPPIFRGENSGVHGTKPEGFCFWLFELLGLQPEDEFVDLFPGSGAVTEALDRWQRQTRLAV